MGTMSKEEILKILEDAKDKNSDVPMRLVRQAFEKLPEPCEDTVSRQAAIDLWDKYHYTIAVDAMRYDAELRRLPSAQPEWGLPVDVDRPLADKEIVSRLRDIQKQIGGSYAIDRAIEIIEAVAERRTDDTDPNCGWEIRVKSKRKMGHWVIIEAPQGYCNYMMCSECRTSFIEDEGYNFCPNCGSDMREGQDEILSI